MEYLNQVFFQNAQKMEQLPDHCIDLIVTSPPYFNIKDYSLDGYQEKSLGEKAKGQIGDIANYEHYIQELLGVWLECHRVLKPNGKLIINTPLMPMPKKELNTHYNRHIFDINSDIQQSILKHTPLFLMDVYLWNRTNPSKKLMFGSYPFPRNFYAQNTTEFITVYVKDGKPMGFVEPERRENSKLSQQEWVELTQQVWNIPVPNKGDLAFGKHSAIMPEEIVRRCVKLYTFVGDVVLDPFTGSGTTLKVARELGRNFVGYEISENYKDIILKKIATERLF